MTIDIRTVSGIQDLLVAGATQLMAAKSNKLEWVRANISTVNAANSLLRTDMKMREEKTAATPKAKPRK